MQAYVNNLARPPASYPTDDEIKEAYEASRANLTVPAEYERAQIYVSSPDNADKTVAANAQKKVTDVSARLQKTPADFAKIAKESSEHKESGPPVGTWAGCQRRSSSRKFASWSRA